MNALVRDRKGPSVERHVVERSSFLIIKNKNKNKKNKKKVTCIWQQPNHDRFHRRLWYEEEKSKKKHTYYSSQVAADLS